MLEIKVCKDEEIVKSLFEKNHLPYKTNSFAQRAMFGEECLGYVLFELDNAVLTVLKILPLDDIMLVDGLLRSCLFVGNEKGATEAFYENDELEPTYKKLGFLMEKENRKLNIQTLFSDTCNCHKN